MRHSLVSKKIKMDVQKLIEILQKVQDETDRGIHLSPAQKREMTGMGESRESFVVRIIKLLGDNDSFLPRNYDKQIILELYKSFQEYREMLSSVETLKLQLYNHFIKYGTSSFKEALKIKKLLDDNPSDEFDEIRKEISRFFQKNTKK